MVCLLYTSDAADEQRGVDLGGRRIIKKKKKEKEKKIKDIRGKHAMCTIATIEQEYVQMIVESHSVDMSKHQ